MTELTRELLETGNWDHVVTLKIPRTETVDFYDKCLEQLFIYISWICHDFRDYQEVKRGLKQASNQLAEVSCYRWLALDKDVLRSSVDDIFNLFPEETHILGRTKDQINETIAGIDTWDKLKKMDDFIERYYEKAAASSDRPGKPRKLKANQP
jgi:hypothetical protein